MTLPQYTDNFVVVHASRICICIDQEGAILNYTYENINYLSTSENISIPVVFVYLGKLDVVLNCSSWEFLQPRVYRLCVYPVKHVPCRTTKRQCGEQTGES